MYLSETRVTLPVTYPDTVPSYEKPEPTVNAPRLYWPGTVVGPQNIAGSNLALDPNTGRVVGTTTTITGTGQVLSSNPLQQAPTVDTEDDGEVVVGGAAEQGAINYYLLGNYGAASQQPQNDWMSNMMPMMMMMMMMSMFKPSSSGGKEN